MQHESYLTLHPTILKKITTRHQKSSSKSEQDIDIDTIAAEIIQKQRTVITEMEARITAYEVQIEAEIQCKVDHKPYIQAVEREIAQIRNEEIYINEQIRNCQLVQNSVTPMQYYLWKKKQRINTYDASIAEVYKLMQKEKEQIQSTIENLRVQQDQLALEIQNYEEKITILHTGSIGMLEGQDSNEGNEETVQELMEINLKIKDQYMGLTNNIQILQQNKDIVCMQVIDNIKSIEGTLKSYFDSQKAKLVKEFKQMQIQSRSAEVSPLTSDEQNYKLDPLLSDYTAKMKEMSNSAPESVRNIITPIMQPMSWEKFHWKDFLEIEPKSEQIYTDYRQLQGEYSQNQQVLARLQQEIKEVSHQIVTEQLRSSEISENIRKLKKNLKK